MQRWTSEQATSWYDKQPWMVGCNFIPSTAINQLEMWQAATFDLATIRRELAWASAIGFNAVRVYLHDLLWDADRRGFLERMEAYLDAASTLGIRTLFVIFDDCWNPNPRLGPQPAPIPRQHNSGWVQSPGTALNLPEHLDRLERYVKGVLEHFAEDTRVLGWDLYNEIGNGAPVRRSFDLLQKTYAWAWQVRPTQPLTSGIWRQKSVYNDYLAESADIVTFHNYNAPADLQRQIRRLRAHGRPILCTEYMLRLMNSRFESCLPIFKRERVGCFNWGLVSGKTQTIYGWKRFESRVVDGEWFHDVFWPDGKPFSRAEVDCIRSLTHEPPMKAKENTLTEPHNVL